MRAWAATLAAAAMIAAPVGAQIGTVQVTGGKVEGVEFPESAKAINDYPITALKDAPNPDGAKAFVAFILSAPARDAMVQVGFQAP